MLELEEVEGPPIIDAWWTWLRYRWCRLLMSCAMVVHHRVQRINLRALAVPGWLAIDDE